MQSTVSTLMPVTVRNYMRSIDELLPDITAYLPNCGELLIRKTLGEVAQQFCRETFCLYDFPEITVVSGQQQYEIPVNLPALVLQVRGVTVTTTSADGRSNSYKMVPQQYAVVRVLPEGLTYLNLVSALTVNITDTMKMTVETALIPKLDQMHGQSAYALPDEVLQRWRAAFVAGTVAFLAAMDKQPWSNPALAVMFNDRFNAVKAEAKNEAFVTQSRQGGNNCLPEVGFV